MGKQGKSLWNHIYNGVLGEMDTAEAKAYADQAVRLYEKGVQAQREEERLDKLRPWKIAAGWIVGVLAVLAVTVGIAGPIYYVEHNDWAGLDRKEVPGRASDAIKEWYGLNDLPENVTLLDRQKGRYLGKQAWEANFRTDDGPLCVYVWMGDGTGEAQAWALKEQSCG